ncbi:flagellar protein FliS [Paenibacillus sp. PvR052]|nr:MULTISPECIES: flagellar export chaperone FliS [unclassified Paenibacillus]MBP1157790.1 flagellar protein FliS [Paenibacillus sp. PvP091]MBP1171474.1 flagellar protein FliS [Paenibacillus sp. PvR098]MBP2442502.1 flagellar protein FliS [Paenibacillus sp. PvP052]
MYTVAQKYQNNQVTTSTPGELTLMLYNGAIKFIKQTKSAILEKQLDKAHHFNLRVQDIINELIITLDRSYPISEQLLIMYDYMKRRMIEANIKKDGTIIDEVEGFFVQFRDTWKEVMILSKQQA